MRDWFIKQVITMSKGKESNPKEHMDFVSFQDHGAANPVSVDLGHHVSVVKKLSSHPLEVGGLASPCNLAMIKRKERTEKKKK